MMNREKQKKEQKTFEYIENPEQIEGFDKIPVPEDLDQRVRAGIEEGKKRRKKIAFRKTAKVGMGMAAAVALASVLCISNLSFAAKMPLIGHIFEQVENNTSVKGDFSQVAETLTQSTENTADQKADKTVKNADSKNGNTGIDDDSEVPADGAYTKTSNGITVTLSEVYYNKNAMYIAMSLYSEEPFPEDIKIKDHVKDYILDFDQAAISGENTFSFMPDEKTSLFNYMEGKFVDDHTFAGMLRVDLSSLETEPTDTFTCHMALDSIRFDNVNFTVADEKIYEGNWDFDLNVKLDTKDTQTVEVNEVNDDGVGLEKVVKTRYELRVYPKDKSETDGKYYFAEVFDANGERMDYAGDITDCRQTYGYDTSKVNIYLCDEDEYMNELKGYYFSEDYEEKKKTKTYEEYIAEHAVYHKEITFDK